MKIAVACFVLLVSWSEAGAPPCAELLEDASTPHNWNGVINVPLNKQFNKFSDHWNVNLRFAKPVNTFNADNVSISTDSKEFSNKDGTSSTTTILKDITTKKLDTRSFLISQNKTLAASVLNQPSVTMHINFNVVYPDEKLLVASVRFNDFVMCVN